LKMAMAKNPWGNPGFLWVLMLISFHIPLKWSWGAKAVRKFLRSGWVRISGQVGGDTACNNCSIFTAECEEPIQWKKAEEPIHSNDSLDWLKRTYLMVTKWFLTDLYCFSWTCLYLLWWYWIGSGQSAVTISGEWDINDSLYGFQYIDRLLVATPHVFTCVPPLATFDIWVISDARSAKHHPAAPAYFTPGVLRCPPSIFRNMPGDSDRPTRDSAAKDCYINI
jgi:hypothetical protein